MRVETSSGVAASRAAPPDGGLPRPACLGRERERARPRVRCEALEQPPPSACVRACACVFVRACVRA